MSLSIPEFEDQDVINELHRRTVEAEAERIRIRREARRLVDMEERMSSDPPRLEEASSSIYAALPPEPPDLIPGVLPSAGAPGIIGETNVGKSLLALEIASTMVTGEPLWGAIKPTRTVDRVVYFLGEHTKRTVQELYHLTGLPHKGDIRIIGPEDLANGLGKGVVVGGLLQQKVIDWYSELAQGAGLVIFDPLTAFVQGEGAENDNTIMRTLVGSLALVAERAGGVCLILSHMGKPRIDQNGIEHRRTSYATRGASAQEDAMTHVFYFRSTRLVDQQPQVFELTSRKFKGRSDRGKIHLARNPQTYRHILLDGAKPVAEAKKIHATDRMAELAAKHPEWSTSDVIKAVATENGVSERTVFNWKR